MTIVWKLAGRSRRPWYRASSQTIPLVIEGVIARRQQPPKLLARKRMISSRSRPISTALDIIPTQREDASHNVANEHGLIGAFGESHDTENMHGDATVVVSGFGKRGVRRD